MRGHVFVCCISCHQRQMTDFQVADEQTAKVRFVHARRGLVPGWGGGIRLAHMVGPHKSAQLLMSAQIVSRERQRGFERERERENERETGREREVERERERG